MIGNAARGMFVGMGVLLGLAAPAADPPKPEPIAAPKQAAVKEAVQEVIVLTHDPLLLPNHRPSAYDVWQNYGVDRRGYFRPRVVHAPYQPYYLYNGVPYYFTEVRTLEFMPYAID